MLYIQYKTKEMCFEYFFELDVKKGNSGTMQFKVTITHYSTFFVIIIIIILIVLPTFLALTPPTLL